MAYCDLCKGLDIQKLFPPNIYRHAKDVAALADSSHSCSLCRMLHRCIAAAGGPYSEFNPAPMIISDMIPLLVEPIDERSAGEELDCEYGHGDGHSDGEELRNGDECIDDYEYCDEDENGGEGEFNDDDDEHGDEDNQADKIEHKDDYLIKKSESDGDGDCNDCIIKLQILEETERSLSKIDLDGFTHIGIWIESARMLTSLTLMVQEGDLLGAQAITIGGRNKYISGRVLTNENPSEEYFNVIRRWLEECGRTHRECGDHSIMPPQLPDRIIDVAPLGGNPRLINGNGIAAQYATLSHCWGGVGPTMTLKCNLEQRMTEIPLIDLPKTFREAITVCRALKIPYLWIDSICIIQDSEQDWEVQSSKMHSIYYESTITLAALDAANSSDGLFLPKSTWKDVCPLDPSFGGNIGQAYVGPPSWDMHTHSSWPMLDETQYYIYQLQCIFPNSTRTYIQSGLLETRAWAMQELRLSTRVLYFVKGEIMWRCTEAIWRQNGSSRSPYTMDHLRGAFRAYEKAFELTRQWYYAREEEDRSARETTYESSLTPLGTSEPGGSDHIDSGSEGDLERKDSVEDKPTNAQAHSSTAGIEQANSLDGAEDTGTVSTGTCRNLDDAHVEFDPKMTKWVFDTVLEHSKGNDIQAAWYNIVEDYSHCHLTYAKDKLPALSGIACRYHSITKDVYLAGHWEINLEKSLFWSGFSGASRVKTYRAPSWSWASVDGALNTFMRPSPESLEIVDAQVLVNGNNTFGQVLSGTLTVVASTMEASWDFERKAWTTLSYTSCSGDWESPWKLPILDCHGKSIAYWDYDDRLYGMWPGPHLTIDTTGADAEARLMYESDEAVGDHGPLWSVATYAPENLLLVEGPIADDENPARNGQEGSGERVYVLVLKRINEDENVYERVGVGQMFRWDDEIATTKTLKIV